VPYLSALEGAFTTRRYTNPRLPLPLPLPKNKHSRAIPITSITRYGLQSAVILRTFVTSTFVRRRLFLKQVFVDTVLQCWTGVQNSELGATHICYEMSFIRIQSWERSVCPARNAAFYVTMLMKLTVASRWD